MSDVMRLTLLICESFAISLAMILINTRLPTRSDDVHAVQTMHLNRTSRFGGVAILISLATGLLVDFGWSNLIVLQTVACAFPLFLVGISEDFGWNISPRWRLLAAALSAVLAIYLCGAVIDRAGFSNLDFLFKQPAIAVAFTVIALTGVSQSFNLLDGLHGLCAFTALIVALCLALIADKGGQVDLVRALGWLAAALIGFLILNFPHGRVFLGDAGATCLGFILSGIAVEILWSQPLVSPWALVLVFFWPIADTLFAIVRRTFCHHAAMRPDRMHFHHVVMRGLKILVMPKASRAVTNPTATAILLPLIAAPSGLGVVFWNRSTLALCAIVLFAALFFLGYSAIIRAAHHRRTIGISARHRVAASLDQAGQSAE